jgi:hypothetical protein
MTGLGGLLFIIGGIFFAFGLLSKFTSRLPEQHLSYTQPDFVPAANAPPIQYSRAPIVSTPPPITHLGANSMATGPQGDFERAQLGQNITVNHPKRGPITGKILGTIRYVELWQRVKSPNEPWVPTGNQYTAHWLGNFMIYEWKSELWLLDEYDALTDKDIATNFMPYAKRFGESNETAEVVFAYPPASWKITDIGKFNVQSVEGTGLRLNTGAVGRFIHCSGDGGRALVVEDYQTGSGGQDTAWIGYTINWDAIQKVG